MTRVKELIRLAFEDAAAHPEVIDDIENEPWFSASHWLVAEATGRVLAATGLRPGSMWMSGLAVPTSTVGLVCTDPEERGKGVGAQLMRCAGDFVQKRGDVLSRLHTWPARYAFYGRLGYAKAVNNYLNEIELHVDAVRPETLKRAEEHLGRGVVRPAEEKDAGRLLAIYEATFSKVTGCLSRSVEFFRRRVARRPKPWLWQPPELLVVQHPYDGVVAYAACSLEGPDPAIQEIATFPGHVASALPLVAHVGSEAHRRGQRVIGIWADMWHPVGWMLRDFPIHGQTDVGLLFLKVHDERRFVDLIKPVLERRAARPEVKLTLELAGIGEVTVGEGQDVRIVADVPHLAALFYNGVWLAGLMGEGALRIEPGTMAAHHAVQELFPDTHAFRCRMDGY
jgi:predicted N-acetyltransferase YhbS